MNWYIAKLVFQIISGEGVHTPQFDEQLILISGRDKKEALHKAKIKGIQEAVSFLNSKQKTVKWQFLDVSELKELEELRDGTELFSQIEETDDAKRYIDLIQQKAMDIESNIMSNILAEAI